MKQHNIYKVTVHTTDLSNNVSRTYFGVNEKDYKFFDCNNGIIYVITDDPTKIYLTFTPETVISIENIGVGYYLE